MESSWTSTTSMPRGNSAALMASRSNRSRGWIEARSAAEPSMPGPCSSTTGPSVRLSTCRISVVERSGYSLLPNAKRSSAGRFSRIADQRKTGDRRIRDDRRAGVELEPFGDIRLSPTSGRRARPAYRDRTGSARSRRCRASSRPARRLRTRYAERCRDAPSHPSRSGRSIAPTTPCRQILRAIRQRSSCQPSPRTSV